MDTKHVDPDDCDLPAHPRQVVLLVNDDGESYVLPYELLKPDEVVAIREFNAHYQDFLMGTNRHTAVTRVVCSVIERVIAHGRMIYVSQLPEYEIKLAFKKVV